MSPTHIIISGASSVGKSTLANECLRKFHYDKKLKYKQFQYIQEVARSVLNKLNITGKDLEDYIERKEIEKFSSIQKKRLFMNNFYVLIEKKIRIIYLIDLALMH